MRTGFLGGRARSSGACSSPVSTNAWDVAGAKAFGYRVAWCSRQDAPAEELGLSADVIVTSLAELPL